MRGARVPAAEASGVNEKTLSKMMTPSSNGSARARAPDLETRFEIGATSAKRLV